MKKIKISFFLLVLVLAFIVFSCTKNESVLPPDINPEANDVKRSEATWIASGDRSNAPWFKLKFFLGHTAEQCGGKCMMIFGQNYHVDCRGIGYICEYDPKARIIEGENDRWTLILMDEVELMGLDFAFPDRSLFITNPQNNYDRWLNIPEQILMFDTNLMQVIIQDAWFSEEQELENE